MTLLSVRNLVVTFPVRSPIMRRQVGDIRAVRGVSLDLDAGETLAVVGESGSGKSTLARAIARLTPAVGGIAFDGRDMLALSSGDLRRARRGIQMVFQDPFSSLNRAWRVGDIVEEPLRVHGIGSASERRDRVAALLERVGLDPSFMRRRPNALSGGQRQRIAIARAIALQPRLVICDEATSALDVSVQAQILNLLADLRNEFGLSYLFITHDLGIVRRFADRVAVMHAGTIVEQAATRHLFAGPLHPYSDALLTAVPRIDSSNPNAGRVRIPGAPPSPASDPPGCLFVKRCSYALETCAAQRPPLLDQGNGRTVACHRVVAREASWRARSVPVSASLASTEHGNASS